MKNQAKKEPTHQTIVSSPLYYEKATVMQVCFWSVSEFVNFHYADKVHQPILSLFDNVGPEMINLVKIGRVAQWESTAFTRQGSEVQTLSRLPIKLIA